MAKNRCHHFCPPQGSSMSFSSYHLMYQDCQARSTTSFRLGNLFVNTMSHITESSLDYGWKKRYALTFTTKYFCFKEEESKQGWSDDNVTYFFFPSHIWEMVSAILLSWVLIQSELIPSGNPMSMSVKKRPNLLPITDVLQACNV